MSGIGVLPYFKGVAIDDIRACNDGDVCIFFICNELLANKPASLEKAIYVDVGSHIGAWSLMIRRLTDESTVIHTYEPGSQLWPQIQTRFKDDSNVIVHTYGLAATDSVDTLVYTGGGGHICNEVDRIEACTNIEDITLKQFDLKEKIHIMKIDIDGFEHDLLSALYPCFENQVDSLICEMNVFDFSKSKDVCEEKTLAIFKQMFGYFPYVYALSRRGAPFCVSLEESTIKSWFDEHYTTHLSTDVLFTHQQIRSMLVMDYYPHTQFA